MSTIEENIRNYLDGSLTAKQRGEIDRLIGENQRYRKALEKMLREHDGLEALGVQKAPPALAGKIMNAYRAEVQAEHSALPIKRKRFERTLSLCLLAVPLLMLTVYIGMVASQLGIRMEAWVEAVKNSVFIWTLILLNIFYGIRLLIKKFHLLTKLNYNGY